MLEGSPQATLILGGARSGKSRFAEHLASHITNDVTYIATAQAFDAEMEGRIAAHRDRRDRGWKTVEAPLDLVDAIASVPPASLILIDCLTLWLSNQLLANADLDEGMDALGAAVLSSPNPIICVSNEVGMGLVPENALGRAFRDAQGHLNQMIAARADLVVFVAAGLPMVLKGTLPVS